MKMIERKAAGEKIDIKPPKERTPTKGPDLVDMLKASIAATKERGKARSGK